MGCLNALDDPMLLRVMLCAETEITLRAEVVRKFPLEN
jgi:hypothetical protein